MAPPRHVKILPVGDKCPGANSHSGKTSLLQTFLAINAPLGEREFYREAPEYAPTVFDNIQLGFEAPSGESLQLGIWDSAGQEEYARARNLSYPGTDVYLLVFDLTKPDTLKAIHDTWLPEIQHYTPGIPYVLVGISKTARDDILEKTHGAADAVITPSQGRQAAETLQAAAYVETCFITLHGIQATFTAAVAAASLTKPKPKAKRQGFFSRLRTCSSRDAAATSKFSAESHGSSEFGGALDAWFGPVDKALAAEQASAQKRGTILGVTVEVLTFLRHQELQLAPEGLSTGDVCGKVVVPAAKSVKGPLLRHFLGRRDSSGAAIVGPITHFASHAWRYKYADLLRTLRDHSSFTYNRTLTQPIYWVDLVSKDQLNPQPSTEEFKTAIKQATRVVAVLDTLTKPVALTRIWCLFEYLHALVSQADLQIFLPVTELEKGLKDLPTLAEGLDVRNAEATQPADIAMIQAEIEEFMGMDAMNKRLCQALNDGTEQVGRQQAQLLRLSNLF